MIYFLVQKTACPFICVCNKIFCRISLSNCSLQTLEILTYDLCRHSISKPIGRQIPKGHVPVMKSRISVIKGQVPVIKGQVHVMKRHISVIKCHVSVINSHLPVIKKKHLSVIKGLYHFWKAMYQFLRQCTSFWRPCTGYGALCTSNERPCTNYGMLEINDPNTKQKQIVWIENIKKHLIWQMGMCLIWLIQTKNLIFKT